MNIQEIRKAQRQANLEAAIKYWEENGETKSYDRVDAQGRVVRCRDSIKPTMEHLLRQPQKAYMDLENRPIFGSIKL